jgi:methionyl-tRNA synthetase
MACRYFFDRPWACPTMNENFQQDTSQSDPSSEREPMLFCPVCSRRLAERKCKLYCEQCGYYMSCADYY